MKYDTIDHLIELLIDSLIITLLHSYCSISVQYIVYNNFHPTDPGRPMVAHPARPRGQMKDRQLLYWNRKPCTELEAMDRHKGSVCLYLFWCMFVRYRNTLRHKMPHAATSRYHGTFYVWIWCITPFHTVYSIIHT